MLALHLGLRYLRRRRAAWLAVGAITLTVAVPVLVLGVMQGWIDVTARQVRANESDLTVEAGGFGEALPQEPRLEAAIAAAAGPGADTAPFVSSWAVLVPRTGANDGQKGIPVQVDGVAWEADRQLGRIAGQLLHKPPVTDLGIPDLAPSQRGTGFITPTMRDELCLRGLEVAAAAGTGLLALPPRPRPAPGVVCGREVLYSHGLRLGMPVWLAASTGTRLNAELSDTIGTGVLEVDRFLCITPLPLAQRLVGYQGKGARAARLDGWRVNLPAGSDLRPAARRIDAATGLRALAWTERRGNAVRSLELQRNILVLVMVAIQGIAVFIVYAVFSTMVAEKRHDIGVLLGIGARRRDIAGAFLLAGLAACVAGGLGGWALGWGVLAALNPLSHFFGIPLFPQDVFYTPDAPTSFDPRLPLLFIGAMTTIGLAAVALPAWRAARIEPIEVLRDHG